MFLLYIGLLFAILFLYGIHRFLLDKRYRLPPGPTPVPYFGNALAFRSCNKSWLIHDRLAKVFGPVFTFYVGHSRFIVLSSQEVIQDAIVNQAKVFSDRPVSLMPGFEHYPIGVLFESGKAWQNQRRFSLKAMRDFGMGKMAMVEKIQEEAECLVSEVGNRDSQPLEFRRLLINAVSNVVCSLVFGKRFEYDDPSFTHFMDTLHEMTIRPLSREFYFFALPFLRYFTKPNGAAYSWKLHNLVAERVREAVKEHRKDFDPENIRDFPDVFIRAEMSSSKNPDEAFDFDTFSKIMLDMFIAGTETTSTLLGWTLLYLTKYPEIQTKCQQAIDGVIESNWFPVPADRPNLVYIDAVMCEALRHATIVPLSLYHAVLDNKGTVNGYEVPPKSTIVYNVWSVHHDQTYWKDPDAFNPDRWIDSNGNLLSHSSHFMPFGTGPRICLGELLARMEFFIFAVSLLQRFNFTLVDKNVSLHDGVPGIAYGPPMYKLIAKKR